MHRFVIGLVLAPVIVGCRAESRTDSAAVRSTIDSQNTKAEAWYAAGQVDSLATIFAEDARQMPPNMAPLVGRDSIKAFWTNAVKWGKWEFDLTAADVVAADSLAVERGTYTLKFTASPGSGSPMPSFEDRGNFVVLWRRENDGVWRVVWDAPVSTLPPAGAPAPAPASTRR